MAKRKTAGEALPAARLARLPQPAWRASRSPPGAPPAARLAHLPQPAWRTSRGTPAAPAPPPDMHLPGRPTPGMFMILDQKGRDHDRRDPTSSRPHQPPSTNQNISGTGRAKAQGHDAQAREGRECWCRYVSGRLLCVGRVAGRGARRASGPRGRARPARCRGRSPPAQRGCWCDRPGPLPAR
jgi:hypothetical protein